MNLKRLGQHWAKVAFECFCEAVTEAHMLWWWAHDVGRSRPVMVVIRCLTSRSITKITAIALWSGSSDLYFTRMIGQRHKTYGLHIKMSAIVGHHIMMNVPRSNHIKKLLSLLLLLANEILRAKQAFVSISTLHKIWMYIYTICFCYVGTYIYIYIYINYLYVSSYHAQFWVC